MNGSTCRSTSLMMRSRQFGVYPGASSFGVYRMNSGSFCSARLGTPAWILPFKASSKAFCVRSVLSTSNSIVGRSNISAFDHFSRLSSGRLHVCNLLLSLITASQATRPSASTCKATTFCWAAEVLPILRGYWATWISGKAPPSPKSAKVRGAQFCRRPYRGGPLAPPAGTAGPTVASAVLDAALKDPTDVSATSNSFRG
mmetsp:Transcript_75708/g.219874  ORF Transcript_75708/g.219874 Transcript_75708/m.219874 type:complete len:200 (+) Transcript_75708:1051-1650(+)